jgi:hypothetical protein
MSLRRLAAAILCAAFTIPCSDAARAVDAYWHGVRSTVWSDGIQGGQSNWYSQAPPNGNARNVPDGTATFAAGAMQFNVVMTQDADIDRMIFATDAPLYTFRLARNVDFYVNGAGLINRSNQVPKFTLLKNVIMTVTGAARFVGAGAKAAQITTIDGAALDFLVTARGGDAIVFNTKDGKTRFYASSSAEDMTITNRTGGSVLFNGYATGAKAHIINEADGLLKVSGGFGPDGDLQIPVGEVDNDGSVDIGTRTLRVARNFAQSADGELSLSMSSARFGSVVTSLNATLGGALSILAANNVNPGSYKVVRAGGTRTGKFGQLNFTGPANLKARLAYSAKEVTLIVETK